MKFETRTALTAALALVVCACADRATAPSDRPTAAAVKFWDANAAANWTERATALIVGRGVNALRLYPYLALAQLRAAEDAQSIRPHPPTASAIGAASAAVLSAYVPAAAGAIEAALDAQEAADPWPGAKHEVWAAGEAIGRAAAARVLAWSAGDGVGLTDPGTPPTTPGHWLWSPGMPMARGNLGARPFYLASGDELRPPPPPAFGSAEFQAALAEVRHVAETRTPEQVAIALYWHANQSAASLAASNDLAVELIRRHRLGDVESARTLFLMNSAAFDALIGCFDAKYEYWLIRPPQADRAIPLLFPVPAHPSYPSAHSCISGASYDVLAAVFPQQRERLAAIAEEASLSRLYAGIHYRFDLVAGLAIGHAVAVKAMAADLDAVAIR